MVAALDLQRQQRVEQFLQVAPALGLLARRQDHRLHRHARAAQAGLQPGKLRGGDMPVGHDHQPSFSRMGRQMRSEEHTSELQSLMRTSYAVFSLKKKKNT